MPQINVTIDGKSYRMACAEGEEAHLAALAQNFDDRVTEMRKAFGEIGDMRLHVMAALTQVDELTDLKRRFAELESEAEILRATVAATDAERGAAEAQIAEGLARAAERIERIANGLAAG
jgi:cell division protein ZapA